MSRLCNGLAGMIYCKIKVSSKSMYKKIYGYLECHLGNKSKFVPLKHASVGEHIHRVGDAIDQVDHTLLHLFGRFSLVYSFLKHHSEGLFNKINIFVLS